MLVFCEEDKPTIGVTKTKNWIISEKPKPPKSEISRYRRIKGISKRGKPYIVNIAFKKGGGSEATSVWRKKSDPKAQRIASKFSENYVYEDVVLTEFGQIITGLALLFSAASVISLIGLSIKYAERGLDPEDEKVFEKVLKDKKVQAFIGIMKRLGRKEGMTLGVSTGAAIGGIVGLSGGSGIAVITAIIGAFIGGLISWKTLVKLMGNMRKRIAQGEIVTQSEFLEKGPKAKEAALKKLRKKYEDTYRGIFGSDEIGEFSETK